LFAVSYNTSHPDEKNGVYVEVDVLDSVMNYGQVLVAINIIFFHILSFYRASFCFSCLPLKRIGSYYC